MTNNNVVVVVVISLEIFVIFFFSRILKRKRGYIFFLNIAFWSRILIHWSAGKKEKKKRNKHLLPCLFGAPDSAYLSNYFALRIDTCLMYPLLSEISQLLPCWMGVFVINIWARKTNIHIFRLRLLFRSVSFYFTMITLLFNCWYLIFGEFYFSLYDFWFRK